MIFNKASLFIIACLITLACVAQQASAEPLTEIYKFTEENFYPYIRENPEKRIFMKFYAPWCRHCKRIAPEVIEAAKSNTDEHIVFGEVDCTENKDLCAAFNVDGYPTLLVIADNKYAEHDGPRDAEVMVDNARNLVTTESFKIIEPPATDFVSVLLRDLLEIWNIRRNALAVLIVFGAIIGYIAHGGSKK